MKARKLYYVYDGSVRLAVEADAPDFVESVFVAAESAEDALHLAVEFDAGQLQPDNYATDWGTVSAIQRP